ncbi:hypothetical protein CDD83_2379 [Cordyceps sp. RAO-2017]|nr:hypothetical protein CDD83_2379 [Cordyceps sp. RAO-2017]
MHIPLAFHNSLGPPPIPTRQCQAKPAEALVDQSERDVCRTIDLAEASDQCPRFAPIACHRRESPLVLPLSPHPPVPSPETIHPVCEGWLSCPKARIPSGGGGGGGILLPPGKLTVPAIPAERQPWYLGLEAQDPRGSRSPPSASLPGHDVCGSALAQWAGVVVVDHLYIYPYMRTMYLSEYHARPFSLRRPGCTARRVSAFVLDTWRRCAAGDCHQVTRTHHTPYTTQPPSTPRWRGRQRDLA